MGLPSLVERDIWRKEIYLQSILLRSPAVIKPLGLGEPKFAPFSFSRKMVLILKAREEKKKKKLGML